MRFQETTLTYMQSAYQRLIAQDTTIKIIHKNRMNIQHLYHTKKKNT